MFRVTWKTGLNWFIKRFNFWFKLNTVNFPQKIRFFFKIFVFLLILRFFFAIKKFHVFICMWNSKRQAWPHFGLEKKWPVFDFTVVNAFFSKIAFFLMRKWPFLNMFLIGFHCMLSLVSSCLSFLSIFEKKVSKWKKNPHFWENIHFQPRYTFKLHF